MRTLTDHKIPGNLNDDLPIEVCDEPGEGGANHEYSVAYTMNPGTAAGGTLSMCQIKFQKGPVKEAGVNGITNEALLAVVIDRMRGFQSGKFSCRENAIALTRLEDALMWLQKRTRERLARGVEGTNVK